MIELVQLAPATLGTALLVFGFAPRLVLRVLVLGLRRTDDRRRELLAELAHVPRVQRPFWVMEQLEVVLVEGLGRRLIERVAPAFTARAVVPMGIMNDRVVYEMPKVGSTAYLMVRVRGLSGWAEVRVRVLEGMSVPGKRLIGGPVDVGALGERFRGRQRLRFHIEALVPVQTHSTTAVLEAFGHLTSVAESRTQATFTGDGTLTL